METGTLANWASALITGFAGILAFVQYRTNSRFARAVKAADEIEALNNDESASAILRLIDWQSANILVKDRTGDPKLLLVDKQAFLLAFRHHSQRRDQVTNYQKGKDSFADETYKFTFDEERLRDMIDRLLGRLERIESLIENGVIREEDFKHYFSYWLNIIDENDAVSESTLDPDKRKALWRYIRDYKYRGVINLFSRYGKTTESNCRRPPRAEA